MIRVGFVFRDALLGWNGGINYYKNLISILLESNEFRPVILAAPEWKSRIDKQFNNVEVHYSELFTEGSIKSKIRKAFLYSIGRVFFFDAILRKYNIDLVSHNDLFPMKYKSKIKSCAWIPDFQSSHFPELFSDKWIKIEHHVRNILVNNATKVCLSSKDAEKDFCNYFSNKYKDKVLIMPFALPPRDKVEYKTSILDSYNLKPFSYFIISNQFWKHKNHMIVVKALQLIKLRGDSIRIIATGAKNDLRDSVYINSLDEYIHENQLEQSFIFTDSIPYEDVKSLQYYSIAIIQPSLFEGWNTSVEEAKEIGKKLILSNIPVHLEQNPSNVVYFDPYNEEDLANKLITVRNNYSKDVEAEYEDNAFEQQTKRWNDFSQRYITILKTTLNE